MIAAAALTLLCIALLLVWAMLQPYIALHYLGTLPGVPDLHRDRAGQCIRQAHRIGWQLLPYNLGAFVVVPLAVLLRDRATGALPAWASAWDNDVSNFGDADWIASHKGDTRAYLTIVRWLLRNRASRKAQQLGYRWRVITADGGGMDRETIAGNPQVTDGAPGCVLYRGEDVYQLMGNVPCGPLVLRYSYGYKVWGTPNVEQPTAIVVAIGATLRGRG